MHERKHDMLESPCIDTGPHEIHSRMIISKLVGDSNAGLLEVLKPSYYRQYNSAKSHKFLTKRALLFTDVTIFNSISHLCKKPFQAGSTNQQELSLICQ